MINNDGDVNFHSRTSLFKSLSYLQNSLEFIEEDNDGLKMRVRLEFLGNSFPYQVGDIVTSNYDDRGFLVTKIEPLNNFLWFGLWEE